MGGEKKGCDESDFTCLTCDAFFFRYAGCARPNIPGVYTRVLAHMNWVISKMMLEVGLTRDSNRGLGVHM